MHRRGLAFGLLVAAASAVGGGYLALAAARSPVVAPPPAGPALVSLQEVMGRPHVVFRSAADERAAYGEVTLAPVSRGSHVPAGLVCERVHMAAGRGLCLAPGRSFGTAFDAKVFDGRFHVRRTISLPGIPSRARVSPDGRYGAVTAFVTGHSYAVAGAFSTQTVLIDIERGTVMADLERFAFTRRGRPLRAPDLNVWGVTFTRGSDHFYATLATGGKTYLVLGDVRARRARVLRENVECPSLSPDGRRIAYKKAVAERPRRWRLHVLDLGSMRDVQLSEARSIDDQAEWLDDERILYGVDGDVWSARADGGGVPRRFLERALSPAVVR